MQSKKYAFFGERRRIQSPRPKLSGGSVKPSARTPSATVTYKRMCYARRLTKTAQEAARSDQARLAAVAASLQPTSIPLDERMRNKQRT